MDDEPKQPVVPDGDRLLTTQEVLSILHIGRSMLYRLVKSGELRAIRIGRRVLRFPAHSVREYLHQPRADQKRRRRRYPKSSHSG